MTVTYEIRKTLFHQPPGFKVLIWAEIPGYEKPQLYGSRFFTDEEEAKAYKKYCEDHDQHLHFSLF